MASEIPQYFFESDVTNDVIDIYEKPKIKMELLQDPDPRGLRVSLEGKCIDYSIANAIRRTVMTHIPIYGFRRENIHIDNDKTKYIYNNNMIWMQIESLPIYDIPNYYDLENPAVFLSDEVANEIFNSYGKEKSTESTDKKMFKIEFFLNVRNDTDTYLFVNTHNAIFKINDKIADNYKKYKPIDILVLRPGDEVHLNATASLGIAKQMESQLTSQYEATTNAIHKEISPTKYEIVYKSLGQLDKMVIFQKACIIIIKKLELLSKYLNGKYKDEKVNSKKIEIDITGEDDTMGGLLQTILQKCKYVYKAGYIRKHPSIELLTIRYVMEENSEIGPIKVLIDSIKYMISVFEIILTKSKEITKK